VSARAALRPELSVWEVRDDRELRYVGAAPAPRSAPASYHADRVFAPDVGSQAVYQAAAKDIVLGSLKGVNGTVFAYGQTGGGKTHTMRAVMHAAVADIFASIKACGDREYLIHVSAIEIYNEVVRDLNVDEPASGAADLENGNGNGNGHGHGNRSGHGHGGGGGGGGGGFGGPGGGGGGFWGTGGGGGGRGGEEGLRLWDDKERGTVVERLTDELVESREALDRLLAAVEVGSHVIPRCANRYILGPMPATTST
jgi:hypothetical protein